METIKSNLLQLVHGSYQGNVSELLLKTIDYIHILETRLNHINELEDFRKKLDSLVELKK
jgi:hypothetical protein